jgi:hypothetical protein
VESASSGLRFVDEEVKLTKRPSVESPIRVPNPKSCFAPAFATAPEAPLARLTRVVVAACRSRR